MLEVSTTPEGQPALRGDLDLLGVPALEAFLARLEGQRVDVDMSGVTFFDSSALRTFLNARRHNADLRIVNASKAVVTVLEITGTTDYLVHGRDIGW